MPAIASRDQLLGAAAAVQLGGVDVREAARDARAQRRDLGRRRAAPSAHLPGPLPHDRQPRPASGPNASPHRQAMRYIGSMAIESVNPATGERLRAFEPHTAADRRGRSWRRAAAAFPALEPPRRSPSARACSGAPARSWRREKQAFGALDDRRDGQADRRRRARRPRSARPPAATTPTTPRRSCARERRGRTAATRVVLPAAGRRAGGDALELSLLAGDPLRGARAGGRQRRPAQARVERPAVRAGARGSVRARRRARRACSRRCSSDPSASRAIIADERVAAVTVTGSEGAGRERSRRPRASTSRRRVLELGGSDPFIVLAERRPDARRRDGGEGAHRQQRPVVHRRQALHRRRRRLRRVRAATSSAAMAALRVGDPTAPDTELGPLATASIRDGVADQVERSVAAGARAADRRAARSTGRATSTRRPCSPTCRRTRRRRARRCSARWRRCSACADVDEAIALANAHAVRPGRGGVDARSRRGASGWRASWKPAASSSTAWSRPTRASRSAA